MTVMLKSGPRRAPRHSHTTPDTPECHNSRQQVRDFATGKIPAADDAVSMSITHVYRCPTSGCRQAKTLMSRELPEHHARVVQTLRGLGLRV